MQFGDVYRNGIFIGVLSKVDSVYSFVYDKDYLALEGAVPISINLPLVDIPYHAETLFPYFSNMLAEGNAATIQCLTYKIDEKDLFTRLLKTADEDTIGAITINEKLTHGIKR